MSLHSKAASILLSGIMLAGPALHAQKPAVEGQTGTAAYYSHVFQGHHTSDHGTFHSNRMTAASATIPLGTKVRITNLKNNRSIVVRVTDRYADKNRLIDVSKGAAQKLGFAKAGTAQVRVDTL